MVLTCPRGDISTLSHLLKKWAERGESSVVDVFGLCVGLNSALGLFGELGLVPDEPAETDDAGVTELVSEPWTLAMLS